MRAYVIGDRQGLASLTLEERAMPSPRPGQALVKVSAAGLNHRDHDLLHGRYRQGLPLDRIPLSDGVGEIVAMGSDRAGFAIGDRVTAAHFATWTDGPFQPGIFVSDIGISIDGWLGDYVLLPLQALVKAPADLSDAVVATLSAAGATVWNILHAFAEIRPGETVLTLGTGGVSVITVLLARLSGAKVIVTSSSDEKLAQMQALGADGVVNYSRTPDWEKAVLDLTGGRGVDVVVETVGMATLNRSIAACGPGARIGLIGALTAATEGANMMGLLFKNVTIKGITSGSRTMLEDLLRAVSGRDLPSPIGATVPFDQARDAYALLAQGSQVGKIVIDRF